MVDFPLAERPVNQIVNPRCLRSSLRSWRERDGCQVMLGEVLVGRYVVAKEEERNAMVGLAGYTYLVAIFSVNCQALVWYLTLRKKKCEVVVE